MNACDRVDSLLSAWIEREASPAEARFIEGHLTACPRCRQEASDVERLVRRLRFLPRPELSAGFTTRVLDNALGRVPAGLEEPLLPALHSPLRAWSAPLAAAAALAIVGYIGFSLRSTGGDEAGARGVPPPSPLVAATERPAAPAGGVSPEGITVRHLDEANPSFRMDGASEPTSLGTVSYVLEDWALREPAGGGEPVLTRVKGDSGAAVVVTF